MERYLKVVEHFTLLLEQCKKYTLSIALAGRGGGAWIHGMAHVLYPSLPEQQSCVCVRAVCYKLHISFQASLLKICFKTNKQTNLGLSKRTSQYANYTTYEISELNIKYKVLYRQHTT